MLEREKFNNFRRDVEDALQAVADKYGVDIKGGSISYTDIEFTMGLKMTKRVLAGGKSYEQASFEKNCARFGFVDADYRLKFVADGKQWVLVGFNPQAPKYPILVENEEGTTYKMPLDVVRKAIFG